jgi:TonB family protein
LKPRRATPLGLYAVRVAVVLVALGGGAFIVNELLGPDEPPKRYVVTKVTQVKLPPPPPPPPPPPQPVVEKPKIKEPEPEQKVEKPEPKKVDEPDPPPTPLTAAAGAGESAYGLGVGTGGGNVIGGSGGGGGGGFRLYASFMQTQIQQALQRSEATRTGRYRVVARLWLDPKGAIQRVQLVSSTGNVELDAAIASVLNGMVLSEPPPRDMPQPVNVRIAAVANL